MSLKNESPLIDQLQKAIERMSVWPDWKKKVFEELLPTNENPIETSPIPPPTFSFEETEISPLLTAEQFVRLELFKTNLNHLSHTKLDKIVKFILTGEIIKTPIV